MYRQADGLDFKKWRMVLEFGQRNVTAKDSLHFLVSFGSVFVQALGASIAPPP
jgi:hypothetical protein